MIWSSTLSSQVYISLSINISLDSVRNHPKYKWRFGNAKIKEYEILSIYELF